MSPGQAIIAVCRLADVLRYNNREEFEKDTLRHKLWYFPKAKKVYGFVLEYIKPIPPIPYKGQLGLWEADLSGWVD